LINDHSIALTDSHDDSRTPIAMAKRQVSIVDNPAPRDPPPSLSTSRAVITRDMYPTHGSRIRSGPIEASHFCHIAFSSDEFVGGP